MPNKAIFLDRDNTLIEDPGYINNPDQVRLLPAAAQALSQLQLMGYKLVIVTNQSAVARGIVTEEVLEQIHQKLKSLLRSEGVFIDRIYYCPYHPDGAIPKYRKETNMRKPGNGMIMAAVEELDIDPGKSWLVGDSYRDITAGRSAGCMTILINSSVNPPQKTRFDPEPDYKAVNIKEAVNIIKMHQRQKTAKTVPPIAPVEQPVQQAEQPVIQKENTGTAFIAAEAPAPATEVPEKSGHESDGTVHQMLEQITRQLGTLHREKMYNDFSGIRFIAGAIQAIVFLCLLISLWFWLDHTRGAEPAGNMIG